MEYGINIRYFSRDIGMERAAELVARAGFSCLDYTPPVSADDWEATLRADLAVFRSWGLRVHQTHAPFGRYVKDPDYPHRLYVERCAEATALLGAEFMVVHGDEFDFASCLYCGHCELFEENQEDCIGNTHPACGGCLWAEGVLSCP